MAERTQKSKGTTSRDTEATVEAARTLRQLLREDESSGIRLAASRAILEATPRLQERVQLIGRIEALDAVIGGRSW